MNRRSGSPCLALSMWQTGIRHHPTLHTGDSTPDVDGSRIWQLRARKPDDVGKEGCPVLSFIWILALLVIVGGGTALNRRRARQGSNTSNRTRPSAPSDFTDPIVRPVNVSPVAANSHPLPFAQPSVVPEPTMSDGEGDPAVVGQSDMATEAPAVLESASPVQVQAPDPPGAGDAYEAGSLTVGQPADATAGPPLANGILPTKLCGPESQAASATNAADPATVVSPGDAVPMAAGGTVPVEFELADPSLVPNVPEGRSHGQAATHHGRTTSTPGEVMSNWRIVKDVTVRRRHPIHRGGRPHGHSGRERPESRPHLSLVTRCRQGRWSLEVDATDFPAATRLAVGAGEMVGSARSHRWPIHVLAPLTVADEAGRPLAHYDLPHDALWFRLAGNDQGRLVRNAGDGDYLLVVPDSKTLRLPGVEVAIEGWRGYLCLNPRQNDALRGELSAASTPWSGDVELQGHAVGWSNGVPVFGGQAPPVLVASVPGDWSTTATIVVGLDRRGGRRWEVPIQPQDGVQTLGGLQQAGKHFVRLYDAADGLLNSYGFVYLPGLSLDAPSDVIWPGREGHVPLTIRVEHDPATVIQVQPPGLEVTEEGGFTTVVVPPGEAYREVVLLVRPAGRSSGFPIPVPIRRCWWRLVGKGTEAWTDRSLRLAVADCRPTSRLSLEVAVPGCSSGSADVWVESGAIRSYQIHEDRVHVPLRELGSDLHFTDQHTTGHASLALNISLPGIGGLELAHLVASIRCRRCGTGFDIKAALRDHLPDHLDEYVTEVTDYQEYAKQYTSLPSSIYCCTLCDYWVPATSQSFNPTTAMSVHHIEFHRPEDPFGIKPVSKFDEARRILKQRHAIPRLYTCTVRGVHTFEADDRRDPFTVRLQHLLTHLDDLMDETGADE